MANSQSPTAPFGSPCRNDPNSRERICRSWCFSGHKECVRERDMTTSTTGSSERLTLPVLPLREMVLFPGITAPVGAGRPGTLRAIESALRTEQRLIFAVAQTENVEQVTSSLLYTVGTIARITQVQRGLGGIQLLLHGEKRGIALHYQEAGSRLEAVVREAQELAPVNPNDPVFEALHREARERAAELGQKSGLPEEVVKQVLEGVTDPGRFADLVAGYLEVSTAERQKLLEMLSVEERLRRVLVDVQRQIGVLDAQEEIKDKVQEELGERQREMFLREQMKQMDRARVAPDHPASLDRLDAEIGIAPDDRVGARGVVQSRIQTRKRRPRRAARGVEAHARVVD